MTAIPGGPVPPGSVVAVVVTRHRPAQLVDSLAAMAKQTHPIAHLVVVDNGPDEPAREVVEACGIPATWLPSWRNLGGAGGFALGMLHALALGADWVWWATTTAAPRTRPCSPRCWTSPTPDARRGVAGGRRRRQPGPAGVHRPPRPHLAQVARHPRGRSGPRAAHRDRGLLQRRPVPRRGPGDDRRAGPAAVRPRRRGGAAPADGAVQAAVRHQPGCGLPAPARHRRPQADARRAAHAQHPDDAAKRYYTYRNRGYL